MTSTEMQSSVTFNLIKHPLATLRLPPHVTRETGEEFARSSDMTHEDYSRIKLIALAATYRTHPTVAIKITSPGHTIDEWSKTFEEHKSKYLPENVMAIWIYRGRLKGLGQVL